MLVLPTMSRHYVTCSIENQMKESNTLKYPFPASDIYFNVDEREPHESLTSNSYFTLLNSDNRHFRFRDWIGADENITIDETLSYDPDQQSEIIKTLELLHSDAIKVLKKHPDFKKVQDGHDEDTVAINFKIDASFGEGTRRLRCNYLPVVDGYCLNIRTKPPKHPYLEDLMFPVAIKEILMAPELMSGLVLFVADCGQGKTTSAVATSASRLRKLGGHCCAFEDPVEYDYQGFHGENGYCIQTNVNGDFAPYLRESLRKYPITRYNQLFCGEIRGPQDAKMCIQASAQGCLVFATLHADSVVGGLKRLLGFLSGSNDGDSNAAADMLASSFRFIFNQRKMVNPGGEGWKRFRIHGDVFYALTPEMTAKIRKTFSDKEFDKLNDVISTQKKLVNKFNKGDITREKLIGGQHVD